VTFGYYNTLQPSFGLHRIPHLSCAGLFLLLTLAANGFGQTTNNGTYEIASLNFDGNETFDDDELRQQMVTRETPGFIGKLLHGISEGLGGKDEYFDLERFGQDITQLATFYEDNGFSSVAIDTVLRYSHEPPTIDILVRIEEGYRSVIDSIQYAGLRRIAPETWSEINDDPSLVKGDPFQKQVVEEEVRRIQSILVDHGYANGHLVRDSSAALRVLSSGNYTIILHFSPGRRYLFGDIHVRQEPDSLRREEITDDLILNQLDYQPGDHFSEARRRTSERNLNRVGIFSEARISTTVPPDSLRSNKVVSLITVRPADKHELLPELTVSDEDKAFNLGTGLGYVQRNFLGGARTFSTRLRFRTQTLGEFPDYFKVNSNAVSNLDLSFEVQQPYVFTNKIKGTWKFSLILDKQKLYRQEIAKNTFAFSDRIGVYSNAYLDWTLQWVGLQADTTVTLDLDDPEIQSQYAALLILGKEVQFNSILSLTVQRDKSNDIFSPSQGFVHVVTLEESGLLPLLLKNIQPGVPFTQFYRVVLQGRWFFDLSGDRFSILATKLKGGFEEKYGESRSDSARVIPQTHRFYGGGGGSVRGWNSRGLIASGIPELGGNLAFEGSMELRTNLFRGFRDDLLDHVWIVTFLDFGNVWSEIRDYRFERIALATGLGFRYDTFFGPFRIDFGLRVYDPSQVAGRQWITQRKFFGETVSAGVLHFGIGHAF
jgi:outer membrane protein assembly factor BamA